MKILTALEDQKGYEMISSTINLNIHIPADKKDIIAVFKAFINVFRDDIKVKEVENIGVVQESENPNRLDEFKKQFGHLKYEAMPTKEDLKEIRTKRYEDSEENSMFFEDQAFLDTLDEEQLKIVEMAREIYEDYIDIQECEPYIDLLKQGKMKGYTIEEAKKITYSKFQK
ncbi:MAG: hypothetical protein WCR69_07440 [Sulfuricurvum sp.]